MARTQRVASVGSDCSYGSLGFELRENRDLARVRQDFVYAGVETAELRCMPQSQGSL